MAKLVAAFGSSHSIMLVSQREDWQNGFRVIDTKNAHYYDKNGNKTDYDTLLASAPAGAEAMVTTEKMGERYDACEAAMDQLSQRIKDAKLDVLLIVGATRPNCFAPPITRHLQFTLAKQSVTRCASLRLSAIAGSNRHACGAMSLRLTVNTRSRAILPNG
jgi:hypothetical protein